MALRDMTRTESDLSDSRAPVTNSYPVLSCLSVGQEQLFEQKNICIKLGNVQRSALPTLYL